MAGICRHERGLLQDKRGYTPVEGVMHKEIDYYIDKKDPFHFIRVDRFVAKNERERLVAALWACEYDCGYRDEDIGNPLLYYVQALEADMVVCHNDREVVEAKLKCPTYHAYYMVRRQNDVDLLETLKDGEVYEYAMLFNWSKPNQLQEMVKSYVEESKRDSEFCTLRNPMHAMGVWMSNREAFNGIAFSVEFSLVTGGCKEFPRHIASILGDGITVDWLHYDIIDLDYEPDAEVWEKFKEE